MFLIKKIFSVSLSLMMLIYMNLAGAEPGKEKYSMSDFNVETVTVSSQGRKISAMVVSRKDKKENSTGILWIHGGGYLTGMKEMFFMSRAAELVMDYGAVVISPDYTLSVQAPYPAAAEDCYNTLLYLKQNAQNSGINDSQLMVGGESAGGGLCAAVCMMARDRGEVNVAFQMPLYPMLDNTDTDSSRDNHGKVWNTALNHLAWRLYLKDDALSADVSAYAAPARQTDYSNLPPAYTFVGNGEPFFCETVQYIENLKKAGVEAEIDIYESDVHAFDMLTPWKQTSKDAIKEFRSHFEYAQKNYFAAQK
ncbi:MAG: alpha/beta hydrolase [Clostridia bacterium]|nr:alpha/beta hydrolase [Clostridia bacterium]